MLSSGALKYSEYSARYSQREILEMYGEWLRQVLSTRYISEVWWMICQVLSTRFIREVLLMLSPSTLSEFY